MKATIDPTVFWQKSFACIFLSFSRRKSACANLSIQAKHEMSSGICRWRLTRNNIRIEPPNSEIATQHNMFFFAIPQLCGDRQRPKARTRLNLLMESMLFLLREKLKSLKKNWRAKFSIGISSGEFSFRMDQAATKGALVRILSVNHLAT